MLWLHGTKHRRRTGCFCDGCGIEKRLSNGIPWEVCYTVGVMKPKLATHPSIRSYCGILKRKPGTKPVTQRLIEENAEEVRREEEKWEQCFGKSVASHRSR